MQNKQANKKTKSLLNFFVKRIQDLKTKRKRDYENKLNFLTRQTYFYYLRQVLKNEVDFPLFIYTSGLAINSEALNLTRIAISDAERLGKTHIEKCFKACLKQAL